MDWKDLLLRHVGEEQADKEMFDALMDKDFEVIFGVKNFFSKFLVYADTFSCLVIALFSSKGLPASFSNRQV